MSKGQNQIPMRAVVVDELGGPEVMRVREVPRPTPLPTEVLVRVKAAGVNPVDWKTREGGGMAGALGGPPFIVGWDVSGVIEAVGFGVTALAVGDEVFGMPWFPRQAGAYAEYVTAPARQWARKPANLSHVEAAAVPLAALTAWQALVDTAGLAAGQRLLVTAAAGGVGHLAVQFGRHLGAEVLSTASARNHSWLRSLGAAECVDYSQAPFEQVVDEVDVVIDLVGDGKDSTSTRSLDVLRPGGILVAIPGASAELLDAARARGLRATSFLVEPDGTSLKAIAALLEDQSVAVEVEAAFPSTEAAEAHRRGESGHTRGKLVLTVDD
ncbi:MAG: NADP-dependent oxidoreductase [Solirubrobacterales bacterium]